MFEFLESFGVPIQYIRKILNKLDKRQYKRFLTNHFEKFKIINLLKVKIKENKID